jgi:plastocyanin
MPSGLNLKLPPAGVRPLAALLVVVLAILLPVASCGDEEPVAISERTLRVRLDEYRVVPQNVRVHEGRLRIVATNVGRLTHNLKVVKQDEDDLEEQPVEIDGTRTAQPNESAAITFQHLAAGEYRMICSIANHDDLGQYGRLIVEKG